MTAAVVCDSQIRALEPLILAVHSLLLHCTAGPLRPLTHVSCVCVPYVRACVCPVHVLDGTSTPISRCIKAQGKEV